MKIAYHLLAAFVLLAAAPIAAAADFDAAAAIPVFDRGRAKPLQTFAREICDAVHNRSTRVGVTLEGYFEIEDRAHWEQLKEKYKGNEWSYLVAEQLAKDPEYAGLLELFPEGKPRKFDATEAVLSWLTASEKWELIPFIYAPHEELRQVLGVKADRGHLQYVSPREVLESESLRDYLAELRSRQEAAEAEEREFKPTTQDERVQELLDRYNRWRSLTFDPREPLTLSHVADRGTRGRFVRQITVAIQLANSRTGSGGSFAERLESLASGFGNDAQAPLVREILLTLSSLEDLRAIGQKLVAQYGGAPASGSAEVPLDEAKAAVIAFQSATKQLAEQLQSQRDRIFDEKGGLSASQLNLYRSLFRELAAKAEDLHRISLELHAALYDETGSLLAAPATNPYALAKHRDTKNTSQPWLSLQAILYGEELIADYPRDRVQAVRRAWSEMGDALALHGQDRDGRLQKAQANLAATLRGLGEAIEPVRRKAVQESLPAGEQDDSLLAYTAYPAQWKINAEVRYNKTNPFQWSWVLSLLALVCFCVAFGAARRPAFWTGVAFLMVCILWTAYGFALRVMVTGWAPVTNMYETVVYVPWVMLILGVWFLLLPLIWSGIASAWRATAVPFTWEAAELDESELALLSPKGWTTLNVAMQPLRFALMVGLFVFLSVMELSHGGRAYFPILPNLSDVTGFSGTVSSLGVWLVGIACLVLTVWFGPRLILTSLLSPVFIPWSWRQTGAFGRMVRDVYPRQTFAGAAAFGASLFFLMASYAPVLDESFQPLQPVLRSNFWLTIHVLTIVASYGAGMLAWGLGLTALGYVLFGKYRDPVVPARLPEGMKPADHSDPHRPANRRPPEPVGVLANYAYRAIQVAVLLLAAGTILGGLWADVSWGRFWGWDPKEVWALISLLVYLAILHGRFAGWFNHFGLIFGTVSGATMIAMSWYGVNFVLPTLAKGGTVGLHSYGEGAGGQAYVFGFVALNWLFLAAATVRYLSQTSVVKPPLEEAAVEIPAELVEKA
jgi:ABC-type transport system involved in cytochrome c biogenesis permease subunit